MKINTCIFSITFYFVISLKSMRSKSTLIHKFIPINLHHFLLPVSKSWSEYMSFIHAIVVHY